MLGIVSSYIQFCGLNGQFHAYSTQDSSLPCLVSLVFWSFRGIVQSKRCAWVIRKLSDVCCHMSTGQPGIILGFSFV